MERYVEIIKPDNFDEQKHFYSRALNSQVHEMVGHFMDLGPERIIKRYTHLHPQVDADFLRSILSYQPKHFFWGGADLFYVVTEMGTRRMVVLETNSCPSGQKSMPSRSDTNEYRGYSHLIKGSFLPLLKKRRLPKGALAVIYDKNYMEASGYAATMADCTGEDVYLIPHFMDEKQFVSFDDGIMYVDEIGGGKIPIRAAFRYVTQKPWNRIPIKLQTFIYNSTLVCLSGGRNKLVANKAYEAYNASLAGSGLKINVPETIKDVSKADIPREIEKLGGKAVIKVPYLNAGQGVYTITSQEELDDFMAQDYPYEQFIVQSLIGHYEWSSHGAHGKYYHIGTVPNKKGDIFIADLRMMVSSSATGLVPCAIYARRARTALEATLTTSSWQVLGTNLSMKLADNQWDSDTSRLLLMDKLDFNKLGIGIDDLIEAYIQTVLTVIAIDQMAANLITQKGQFRMKLFQSLDDDASLVDEILV